MLDLETHLRFDRNIPTEPRFGFRNWLEGWCATLSDASKVDDWKLGLLPTIKIIGLKENDLDADDFCAYVFNQHKIGGWTMRVPSGDVTSIGAQMWILRGEIECYTAGLLSCAGPLQAETEVMENTFAFSRIVIEPRIRVIV